MSTKQKVREAIRSIRYLKDLLDGSCPPGMWLVPWLAGLEQGLIDGGVERMFEVLITDRQREQLANGKPVCVSIDIDLKGTKTREITFWLVPGGPDETKTDGCTCKRSPEIDPDRERAAEFAAIAGAERKQMLREARDKAIKECCKAVCVLCRKGPPHLGGTCQAIRDHFRETM